MAIVSLTAFTTIDGVATFVDVPSGNYRLELMQGVLTSARIDGKPLGVFAELTVDGDGGATPAVIDWSDVVIPEDR